MPRFSIMPKKQGNAGTPAFKKTGVATKKTKKQNGVLDSILKNSSGNDYYEILSRLPHPKKEDISAPEGQLSVDVIATDAEIIVSAAVAGVRPEDVEIAVAKDMLTIRGRRVKPQEVPNGQAFLAECFWGNFSRTIILPSDIKPEEVRALFRNGILFITLPKHVQGGQVPIMVVDE